MRVIIFFLAAIPIILSVPDCGINYIKPDNIQNASRFSDDVLHQTLTNLFRIVGGYEAVPGSWPWASYLKWRGKYTCSGKYFLESYEIFSGEYTCGGTLLTDQWILSAGHCFYGREEAGDWEIVLGEHDDTQEEGREQVMAVEKIILHPQYSPPGEL